MKWLERQEAHALVHAFRTKVPSIFGPDSHRIMCVFDTTHKELAEVSVSFMNLSKARRGWSSTISLVRIFTSLLHYIFLF